MRRALENVDKAYGAKMEKLEKEKAEADKIGMTSADWSSDHQEGEFELDALLTEKMMMEAEKFDVPLPTVPFTARMTQTRMRTNIGIPVQYPGGTAHCETEIIWMMPSGKRRNVTINRWARYVTPVNRIDRRNQRRLFVLLIGKVEELKREIEFLRQGSTGNIEQLAKVAS